MHLPPSTHLNVLNRTLEMISIGCFGLEFFGVELRNLSREKVIYLFISHSSLNSFFLRRVPTVTIVVVSGKEV